MRSELLHDLDSGQRLDRSDEIFHSLENVKREDKKIINSTVSSAPVNCVNRDGMTFGVQGRGERLIQS